jgi:hypothetical protein
MCQAQTVNDAAMHVSCLNQLPNAAVREVVETITESLCDIQARLELDKAEASICPIMRLPKPALRIAISIARRQPLILPSQISKFRIPFQGQASGLIQSVFRGAFSSATTTAFFEQLDDFCYRTGTEEVTFFRREVPVPLPQVIGHPRRRMFETNYKDLHFKYIMSGTSISEILWICASEIDLGPRVSRYTAEAA